MLCGWKGNRRSGVALAMHHRLSGQSTYGLRGQCVGDEHPIYAALEHGPLDLFYIHPAHLMENINVELVKRVVTK